MSSLLAGGRFSGHVGEIQVLPRRLHDRVFVIEGFIEEHPYWLLAPSGSGYGRTGYLIFFIRDIRPDIT